MEISRKWRFSCLLLGLFFLATTLQGVQGEVESEGPSESECRPYIEKALKELETADTEPVDPGASDQHAEATTDDSEHDTSAGEHDTENGESTESTETQQEEQTPEASVETKEDETSVETKDEKSAEEAQNSLEGASASTETADETESTEQADESAKEDESAEESVTEAQAESHEVQAESQEIPEESQEAQADEAQAESQETQDESQETQPESQETETGFQGVESQESEPHAETESQPGSQEVKAESEETATESEEATAESHDAAATSQEAAEESQEAATESQEAAAESHEAAAESQKATEESQEAAGETQDAASESQEAATESQEAATESQEAASESKETDAESQEATVESKETPEESIEESTKSAEQTDGTSTEATEGTESTEATEEVAEFAEKTDEAAVSAEKTEDTVESAETAESLEKVESKEIDETAEQVGDSASQEQSDQPKEAESIEEKSAEINEVEAVKESVEEVEAVKEADNQQDVEIKQEEAKEASKEVPEEDLILGIEKPDNLRPRDQVDQLLKLDDSNTESESVLNRISEVTLKELKRLYENAIKPLETLYKYRDLSNRHFGDSEIFSKPLVLFMGPWSGGKSSIINYLLDNEYNTTSLRTGAEPSPAYFNLLMYGEEAEVLDGTQLAADFTFAGLQKFGQGLEERLRGLKLPSKLLQKINIVEIPGILEVRKQVSRVFPFNDACQWFIDRADIIFLVYDPSKLDVGPETEAILDQLKGREHQTRIILNKADQVKPEELMRVQGALIWNISPLMSSAQPPVMYTTSLWSRPYEIWAPVRLLQAQERAFLRDLRSAVDKRIENKISSARRFAVRVRNHAKMVDCYLTTYYNHKSVFGNRKQVSDQIIEHPQDYHIYEGLSTLTNISRYDLPDPDVYKDFFRLNALYDFQQLSATCTYFRGCPINRLDIAIAYDLPELVGKHKKLVESALTEIKTES